MYYEALISIHGKGSVSLAFDVDDPLITKGWIKRKLTAMARIYASLMLRASTKVILWGDGNLIEEWYVHE